MLDDALWRKRDEFQRQAAGLELGEVENVVENFQQVVAGVVNADHRTALVGIELGLEQVVGEAEHRVHRGADLVTHHRHEARLRGAGRFGGLGVDGLLVPPACDRDTAGEDDQRADDRHHDQQDGHLLPASQHAVLVQRHRHHDRIVRQHPGRAETCFDAAGAGLAELAAGLHRAAPTGRFHLTQCFRMRICRQQQVVIAHQGDFGVGTGRGRGEEILDIALRHRPQQQAHELAVGVVDAAREVDVPAAVAAVPHRRADVGLEIGSAAERLEVIAIGHVDVGDRPVAGKIDQLARLVDHRHGVDLWQADDLLLEQEVRILAGHRPLVRVSVRDFAPCDIVADARQNEVERLEGAVGLLRERQIVALQIGFGGLQRAFAQIAEKDQVGADDRHDQRGGGEPQGDQRSLELGTERRGEHGHRRVGSASSATEGCEAGFHRATSRSTSFVSADGLRSSANGISPPRSISSLRIPGSSSARPSAPLR